MYAHICTYNKQHGKWVRKKIWNESTITMKHTDSQHTSYVNELEDESVSTAVQ